MSEFDPSKPGQLVHDRINDERIECQPEQHGRDWQQQGGRDWGDGLVEWCGLLLDGWMERPQVQTQGCEHAPDDDFYDDFPR